MAFNVKVVQKLTRSSDHLVRLLGAKEVRDGQVAEMGSAGANALSPLLTYPSSFHFCFCSAVRTAMMDCEICGTELLDRRGIQDAYGPLDGPSSTSLACLLRL
jgi:hypothetical protein